MTVNSTPMLKPGRLKNILDLFTKCHKWEGVNGIPPVDIKVLVKTDIGPFIAYVDNGGKWNVYGPNGITNHPSITDRITHFKRL